MTDNPSSAASGIAACIRILELPDLPEKGDVSDWLADGGTAESLSDLIAQASAWKLRVPFLLVKPMRAEAEQRRKQPDGRQEQKDHTNPQETTEQEQTGHKDESPSSDNDKQISGQEQKGQEHESTRNVDEAALIDELAKLNHITYDRRRKEAAKRLGISVSALDKAVEQRRAEIEQEREAREKQDREKDKSGRCGFFFRRTWVVVARQ